ncbi:MAG: SAM-dependent methyltransferase [Mariprofundus sp.]
MTAKSELEKIISERTATAGGFLPFNAYMQAALYEPELGYYEAKTVFGESGDFVTAPELGPWLSLGFTDLVMNCWQQMGEPSHWCLLEQGSGSGKLLASLVDLLAQILPVMPERIYSIERSHGLRERQRALFDERGVAISIHATLDEVEPADHMIALSNELPDAFPVRCFCYQQGEFHERGVCERSDGTLEWMTTAEPMQRPIINQALTQQWADGYISEFNPDLPVWQQSLARVVKQGFVLTLDYGYSQQEYYRAGRAEGTLMAHLEHKAIEDVLSAPGSRDITAHVDFSALVHAGRDVGFEPVMWMSQGGWLAQSPSVQAFVQELALQGDTRSMHLLAHAKRMLMPFGLGEVFKLLVQSVGVDAEKPAYLHQFDHLDQLGTI